MEKLWPTLAQTSHATKISTQNLIDRVMEKIGKQFDTPAITEDTNESAMKAAADLWRPLVAQELQTRDRVRDERNEANTRSYRNLMESLNKLFHGDPL